MPQISKVRVVNFNYNDGNRLIADELFNFNKHDESSPLNTLMNIANGGGKSVLVQLMLQPIVPKAKVAGRRIESFFKNNRDHCFVLLEWCKDNSDEKLLTGIAIKAHEATSSDDKTSDMGIKYYTFYANYKNLNDPYSIANLPLSEKENGKFIAADFNRIKNLSKKSDGRLVYYSSDDSREWKKQLKQYNIIYEEWQMIAGLNSEEGGLSKYFGSIKKSDDLIDKFFIKTIEDKKNRNSDKEDSSLSTMVIDYAQEYSMKIESFNKKNMYEHYLENLKQIKPTTEKLWNDYDKYSEVVASAFAFKDEITNKQTLLQNKNNNLESELIDCLEQIRTIKHEKCSKDYYEAKTNYDEICAEYELLNNQYNECKVKIDEENRHLDIIECAELKAENEEMLSENRAYSMTIDNINQNNENKEYINDLKCSINFLANKELALKNTEVLDKDTNLKSQENELNDLKFRKNKLNEEQIIIKSLIDRLQGKIEKVCEDNDQLVKKLNIGIERDLLSKYSSLEIAEIRKDRLKSKSNYEAELVKDNEELSNVESTLENIPTKIANLEFDLKQYDGALKLENGKKNKYENDLVKMLEIEHEYGLAEGACFNNGLKDYLEKNQTEVRSQINENARKIESNAYKIDSVKNGVLHIYKPIVDYLNASGISYDSCENYLFNKIDNNRLTKEDVLRILSNYPVLAYGIIVDENDKDALIDQCSDFLPSMIPLFTNDDINDVLESNYIAINALASYSKEYFNDRANYLQNLNREKELLNDRREMLTNKQHHIDKQLELAKAFDYDENFKTQNENEITNINNEIIKLDSALNHLNEDSNNYKETKEKLKKHINELNGLIISLTSKINDLDVLIESVNHEDELESERNGNKKNLKLLIDDIQKNDLSINNLANEIEKLKTEINSIYERNSELKKYISETDGVVGKTIVDRNLDGLYSELETLISNQNEEIEMLRSKISKNENKINENEETIRNYGFNEDDYSGIDFSLNIKRKVKELLTAYDSEKERLVKSRTSKASAQGEALNKYNTIKAELNEFGGVAIDYSLIKNDFEVRIKLVKKRQNQIEDEKNSNNNLLRIIDDILNRFSLIVKEERNETDVKIILSEDLKKQFQELSKEYEVLKDEIVSTKTSLISELNTFVSDFKSESVICDSIKSMLHILNTKFKGDVYYSIFEKVSNYIDNTDKIISQINADLKDINSKCNELINHCLEEGKSTYDELKNIEHSSMIKVYDDKDKKQMLKFSIPKEVDQISARERIANEIDFATKNLAKMFVDDKLDMTAYINEANKYVSSKNLLRKYINSDTIKVEAYKIDQNPMNAKYRSWEETQVNNSGAEKFVVYFAVVLSIMNFTRNDIGAISNKLLHSTLILDNPFGATSSPHILKPMFEIAKHFKVQLICLSDINKTDVVNCFDLVIKAYVKKLSSLSSKEMLTHEGNELIEHGFYRSEQRHLF